MSITGTQKTDHTSVLVAITGENRINISTSDVTVNDFYVVC